MGANTSAPSLRDIGARAGVSASTVSRALRQDPRISAATRERVRHALDEIKEQMATAATADQRAPTQPARANGAPGSSDAPLIGVLVPEHDQPRPPSSVYLVALEAARAAAEARGVGVVVASYTSEPGERTYGDRLLRDRAIAGAVVLRTHRQDERFEKLRRSGVPFVVVNRVFADPFAPPHVGVDHREVGRLATVHLLELGHRHIAFVRFPASVTSLGLRYEGYAATLRAHGLDVDERLVIDAPFTLSGAQTAAQTLVERFWSPEPSEDDARRRPTALLVLSDRHAVAAMQQLGALGIRVPQDVSVVGADDADEASLSGLTTVCIPWAAMARIATESLLGVLSVRGVRRLSIVLDTHLVVRGSTAPRHAAAPVSTTRDTGAGREIAPAAGDDTARDATAVGARGSG